MNIRPIRAVDVELYRSILERTTAEDRYCRFLHAVNDLDPREIRRFVEPSSDILGFISMEGGRALGAAHACFQADGCAELAIVVAHDARRQGVAQALLARLIHELSLRDCPRLIAYVLPANHGMTHLARSNGMTCDGFDPSVATWTLEVPRPIAA